MSIIGCLVSIIVVLTSTASGLVWEEMFFLTSFSLFRRAMNRTPWALQVCACDRTPLRERLACDIHTGTFESIQNGCRFYYFKSHAFLDSF